MRIGVYGVAFQSTNKGCEALAYSCLGILNSITEEEGKHFEIFIIQKMPTKFWIKSGFSKKKVEATICPLEDFSNLTIKYILPLHSRDKIFYSPKLSSLDLIIDFTEGDSFSDIYGRERFFSDTNFKLLMMKHHVPYILGSQTIGPFKEEDVGAQAAEVIKKCTEVYARDDLSFNCTKEVSGREPILTTDVAFLLPYRKEKKPDDDKLRIGFNPSGLLWQQKAENSKGIRLTVDYQTYCRRVIEYYLTIPNAEVFLISHATSLKPDGTVEDDSDIIPCEILHKEYNRTKKVNIFESAIAAKSFISTLDFFTGARMHATIAAISTGVPVVPFSYSRKFEGLFGSIDYLYLVHGTEDTTEKAIQNTIEWFENRNRLAAATEESNRMALDKLNVFVNGIKKYILK